jgi:hypothetical protein
MKRLLEISTVIEDEQLYIRIKIETIQLLYIDLFCGTGGTSTGVESVRAEVFNKDVFQFTGIDSTEFIESCNKPANAGLPGIKSDEDFTKLFIEECFKNGSRF